MKKFTFVLAFVLTLLSFQTVSAQTGNLLPVKSSEFSIAAYGDNVAAKAYDGDVNTYYWSGGATVVGSTFKLYLGGLATVNEIKLVFASGDRTSAADVEISTDGSEWTKVDGFTNGTELSEFTCNANGASARYVRLKIVTPNGGVWFKLCEFQVYGVMTDLDKNLYTAYDDAAYVPNFTGSKATDRPLNGVSLNGSSVGNYSLSLTDNQKSQLYVNATTTTEFVVFTGEEITPVTNYGATWMHSYVYVDADKNGFTASIDANGYSPIEDLVSYSTYNPNAPSGQWLDSKGNTVGNNTVKLPSFNAPATPGVYRMRYKIDWNSIDPAGCTKEGNTLQGNRGTIVDVILNVVDPLQYAKMQFEAAYVKAETLLDRAYKTTETKVALQVDDPDADNYLWCNDPDPTEGDIKYLIDGKNGEYAQGDFFHSSWHSSTAPLHYLQVDMGEGKSIEDFYIAYHTRNFGGATDFPKEIQVMGSNEKDANFVEIANITSGLPQSANTSYKSSLIRSIKSYRYIRFNIKATRVYWHMAEFELICHERPFAELTDNYAHLQTEVEALKTLYTDDAYKNFVGNTVEEYKAAMTTILDAVYNAGKITDPAYFENGKAYTFVTTRGWMGAKSDNSKLISTAYTSNGVTGSATDPYFQWTVYKSPKNNYYLYNVGKGMYMGVEKSNNTAVSFSAQPAATTLTFKKSNNATYPIMFSTDGAGVVNHSGSHASGLINWTGGWNNLGDGGSNHQITEVDDISLELLTKIEKEVAHFEALVELDAAIATADAYLVTHVGAEYGKYSSSNPDAEAVYTAIKEFRAAVTAATAVADIESKTAELQALMATFSLNVPAANSYVRIAYDFGGETGKLYVQGEASGVSGKANSPKMTVDADAASILYFDDSKLLSYTAGLYLNEDGGTRGFQAAAGEASFEAGSVVGTLAVKVPSYMHANTSGDIRFIDHCGGPGCAAHNMIVEAVTELPVTVTAAGYASFYAPVALEIPAEGVEVFYATEVEGDYVSLVKIESGKIPANTGVIIKANANTYNFAITGEEVAAIEDNIFKGTVNKQTITKENGSYYVLGIVDGKVGMYNAVNGEDKTTFINAGHKAYMYLAGAASSAGYRFDFDGTTGITEVETENANDAVIYDLTGRRVQDMNRAGIYIVNGKKVLVK